MSDITELDNYLNAIGVVERWCLEDSLSGEGDVCAGDNGNNLIYKSAADPLPDVQSTLFPGVSGGKGFTEITQDHYCVDSPTPAALVPANGRSYLMTFKADMGNVEYIFSVGDGNNNVVTCYTNAGNFFAQHRLGSTVSKSQETTTNIIQTGSEHQVIVVIPADGSTLKIYVDGVLQTAVGSLSSNFADISIGAAPTGAGNLTGAVYDVTILSAAITADQVSAIYNRSIGFGASKFTPLMPANGLGVFD